MQVIVFENGNIYFLKNRKNISNRMTGRNKILDVVNSGKY